MKALAKNMGFFHGQFKVDKPHNAKLRMAITHLHILVYIRKATFLYGTNTFTKQMLDETARSNHFFFFMCMPSDTTHARGF